MSPGGPGNIIIRIGAETAQALHGINSVNKSLGDTMTKGQKATAGLHKAALPAAAALGVLGAAAMDATKAAMEDQAAQAKLTGQLDRVTGATTSQIAATDDWITKTSMATGVADDELRPALGKLATATGDLGEAQKEMALALDVSAQTGKSLESVTTALAKAHAGSYGAISKLVPGLDKATVATKDFGKVTGELARLSSGAAAEAASTNAGKMKIWQVQIQELKESLGAALLPAMQAVMDMLIPFTALVSEHTGVIKIAVAAIALFAGGILAANAALKVYRAGVVLVQVATKVWTAIQWLLNVALRANPIGLIITALALLAVGLVVAYKKSDTFRAIVQAALHAVETAALAVAHAFQALFTAASNAFNWIVAHWKLALLAFGPLGAAVYVVATNFDKVKAAGVSALNAVKAAIDAVAGAIHAVIHAVEDLIGALGRIHVPHISLPSPFALAPVPAASGARSSGAGATSGVGGTTINVYGAVDPEGTARAILRVLSAHERRQGRRI